MDVKGSLKRFKRMFKKDFSKERLKRVSRALPPPAPAAPSASQGLRAQRGARGSASGNSPPVGPHTSKGDGKTENLTILLYNSI